MSEGDTGAKKRRRRSAPLLWGSGAVAAAVLVLGVNGTLSSWTSAIITNNNNSVASASSLALVETQTTPTGNSTICDTAAAVDGTNAVTCAGINKYGGIGDTSGTTGFSTDASGVPLAPGGSQSVTVNLKNDGTGAGSLTLAAGSCVNHAYPDSTGANTTTYNLCNEMQLSVSCDGPATFAEYTGTVGAFTGGTIGPLAATASTNCTFTVSLPSDAPSGFASQYLTQAMTWTLA
ncbi:MAG TPA: hypothetical protein VN108_04710 [Marmoricola sp.]|nr:hypothetical protein [Marmoricola sp.]